MGAQDRIAELEGNQHFIVHLPGYNLRHGLLENCRQAFLIKSLAPDIAEVLVMVVEDHSERGFHSWSGSVEHDRD